jgi:ADP-ribose pyrophosphatase YjhB (NUDIX family)
MTEFVWHEANYSRGLEPIRQVLGFVFDGDGNVLLLRQTDKPGKRWNIPGGHPKAGESLDETLRREVYEETDVRVGRCGMVGYQEVLGEPDSPYYQLRFAGMAERIDAQTEDPAKGTIHERMFVPSSKVMHYITYPQYRDALEAAVRWYEREKEKN